ncbi:Methyltransferase type 12 [Macrophomina phaseolina MS6]|uniref:Methyltransferase type 12 n=1 Tax=Macrophomina phaseolina (strain MS6) TaxID=1126212 RepID=K2RSC1_MACPH|nr:Methyltransferase type 12 [Macrophomina phaseolina MS6]
METTAAYDAWAAVYDEDGNVLQGIDDLELEGLLPAFLRKSVGVVEGGEEARRVLRVLDLGCGTGRNTEKVVGWAIGRGEKERLTVEVVGVDASKGMLDKAKAKLTPLLEDADGTNLSLLNHDPFQNTPTATLPPPLASPFHAVMSTLVLEHLPLPVFFETLASLLAPGGYALVTNMHPEMGAKSQAGFVSKDAEGRTIKVRGKSWAYGVQETVEAAKVVGLETVDVLADEGESRSEAKGVRERGIDEALIKSGKIGERGWKWVGVKVWYGFVVRKVGGEKN